MTHPGYEELKKYLQGNNKPAFIKFVSDNTDKIPAWSIEDNTNTGPALFDLWYERYKQAYAECNGALNNLEKLPYNYLIWSSILDKSKRRK